MAEEPPATGFDYPLLLRRALTDLIRNVLRGVAEEGLPGDHQLYLTFHTEAPGVVLSATQRKRFPGEMTIVLQHQFWSLEVGDDAFSVTLRFGGAPERLTVPFEALTAFVDPAANFGLRLDAPTQPEGEAAPEGASRPEGPDEPAAPSGEAPPPGRARTVVPFRPRSGTNAKEEDPA
jgi:uncharacterized protein